MPHRPMILALVPILSLAACADGSNPVRDLALATGVTGGEPRPAPDFVTRTRPAEPDYTPVGVSAPPRRLRVKDKDKVAGAEAEMNELRTANESKAARARRAAGEAAKPVKEPVRDATKPPQ